MSYRCLSIQQPWLGAILEGWKTVENRGWQTSYRGLLLLHASAKADPGGFAFIRSRDLPRPRQKYLTLGAVIGAAELVRVCRAAVNGPAGCCSPWAMSGQYHWHLEQVRRFPNPIPAKGSLGLWAPTRDVAGEVDRELANAGS